jgi:hypothetical protein
MFKLNRLISEYRIKVEHTICELKCYKVMGTRWNEMMQSHQRLSQYKIQNYENKIIQRLQKFLLFLLRPSLYISCQGSARIRTRIHSHTLSV